MARHGVDLDALSPQEQLDLLDQLWEKLGRNPDVGISRLVAEVSRFAHRVERS